MTLGSFATALWDGQQFLTSFHDGRSIGGAQINDCSTIILHGGILIILISRKGNDRSTFTTSSRLHGHGQESRKAIEHSDSTMFFAFLEASDERRRHNLWL